MGLLDQIRNFLGGAGNEIQQHVIQPVEQSFQRVKLPPVNISKLQSFDNSLRNSAPVRLANNIGNYGLDVLNNKRTILPYAHTENDNNLAQTGIKKLYNFGAGVVNNVGQEGIINPLYDVAQGTANRAYGLPSTPYNQLHSGAVKLGYDLAGGGVNAQNTLADVGQTLMPILNTFGGGKAEQLASQGAKRLAIGQLAKRGALQGAKIGGAFGVAQGLQDNRENTLGGQLLGAAGSGILGAGMGAAIGGGSPFVGRELGQLTRDFSSAKGKLFNPETIFDKNKRFTNSGSLISSGGDHPQMLDPNAFKPESFTLRMLDKTGGTPVGMSIKDVSANQIGNQSDRMIPKVGQKMTVGTTNQVPTSKVGPRQSQLQSPITSPEVGQGNIFLTNVDRSYKNNIANTLDNVQSRGLTSSVKESGNIGNDTKANVAGLYKVKSNNKLLGEAQALLSEGGKIDFKGVQGVDKKVAAAMQEAINLDKTGNPEAAANLYNNLAEHATELGRGVQAFNLLDKMSPEAIALSVAGKIQKFNRENKAQIPQLNAEHLAKIGAFVDNIRNLPEGRERNIAIHEFEQSLQQIFPSTVVDKAIAVWKAGLLTSLRTHERNLLGNGIMLGSEVAKDIPGSIADKVMSLRTGKRTLSPTVSGLSEFGSKKTRQQISDLVTKGYDPSQDITKFDLHKVTWDNTPIQQALKKYTDAVFRPLGAEDRAFLNAEYQRSLFNQAKAEAINAGKKGNKEFISNLVKNPSEEMLAAAVKDADYATFHDKTALSGLAASGKRYLAGLPGWKGEVGKVAGEIAAPFTGVPSSIVGKTAAYSPLGLVKGAFNMGKVLVKNVPELQRQAAQEVGRGIMGTGIFGLGAYLMSKGLMTGQPKDLKEANLWAAQGKQANSVLINGKWRSINSVGPQSLVALAGAKYNEETNKEDGTGSVGNYAMSLGKDQLNQTFLAGVQGPLNAITDPARYGQSYLGNQAASGIPNIIKDTAKAFDPNQREANKFSDYITNSIPGVRNLNTEKRDVLGNVMKQEPTGVGAFVDLFNSKSAQNNAAIDELARLYGIGNDATPSKLKNTQTVFGQKLKLSPEELNNLEAQSGGLLRPALESLVTSDGYKALSDEEKSAMIQKTVTGIRAQAKNGLSAGNVAATFDANSLDKKNKVALNKLNFENSNQNFMQKDGYTYRKGADGQIQVTTDVAYNTALNEKKMSDAEFNNNTKDWMQLAQKQYDNITKQLQDPNVDEMDKLDLQKKLRTLVTKAVKIKKQRGFKKPKKPKKIAPVKFKNVKVSASRTVINKSGQTKKLTLKDLYAIKK